MRLSLRAGRILLALIFLVSLPAVTTRIYASDEVEAFSWLHSWFFDRDVNFENEYQRFYDSGQVKTPSFHETFLERTNEAGRRFNVAAIAYGSAVYGFAAILLSLSIARRLTGEGVGASLAVWIGTPLLFYMYV